MLFFEYLLQIPLLEEEAATGATPRGSEKQALLVELACLAPLPHPSSLDGQSLTTDLA